MARATAEAADRRLTGDKLDMHKAGRCQGRGPHQRDAAAGKRGEDGDLTTTTAAGRTRTQGSGRSTAECRIHAGGQQLAGGPLDGRGLKPVCPTPRLSCSCRCWQADAGGVHRHRDRRPPPRCTTTTPRNANTHHQDESRLTTATPAPCRFRFCVLGLELGLLVGTAGYPKPMPVAHQIKSHP